MRHGDASPYICTPSTFWPFVLFPSAGNVSCKTFDFFSLTCLQRKGGFDYGICWYLILCCPIFFNRNKICKINWGSQHTFVLAWLQKVTWVIVLISRNEPCVDFFRPVLTFTMSESNIHCSEKLSFTLLPMSLIFFHHWQAVQVYPLSILTLFIHVVCVCVDRCG